MLILDIKSTALEIAKKFGDLAVTQFPFALARALSWAASDSQKELRRELPHRFILRNTWTAKGIRTNMTQKRDYRVWVYTLDEYMDRQEDGAIKRPKNDQHLAIPASVNRTARGIIRKRDLPNALKNNKNVFKIDENTNRRQSHGLPFGLYRKNRKDNRLQMLYTFSKTGKVKPRWGFSKTVDTVIKNRFERLFMLSLDDAIKTAKR